MRQAGMGAESADHTLVVDATQHHHDGIFSLFSGVNVCNCNRDTDAMS